LQGWEKKWLNQEKKPWKIRELIENKKEEDRKQKKNQVRGYGSRLLKLIEPNQINWFNQKKLKIMIT
jgi:hypothetical protein